tara:strand:- start:864 stop:1202 length:339 start_codon:yes stop_codon:yes gene_type:complete
VSKNRKLSNLKMLGISNEALQHFVDGNKGFLFLETLAGIKQAIRRKKPIAEICSINSKDVIATIEKEGWENALSSSLGYFESEDQFELCKDINTTLKMLRHERTTKPIKRIP